MEILAPARRSVHRLRKDVCAWRFINEQKSIGQWTQNFPGGNDRFDLFIVADRCIRLFHKSAPKSILLLLRAFDVVSDNVKRMSGRTRRQIGRISLQLSTGSSLLPFYRS